MQSVRRFVFIPAMTIVICLHFLVGSAAADRPLHFDYPTKLLNLETGYLLGPGGNAQIGIGESGFGVRGRMQFTTNLLFDVLTFVNGQVKVGLLTDKDPLPALAAGFGYYNLISSEYIIDAVVREAFTDEDIDLSSELECYSFFLSISKKLHTRARVHAGYQYHYLEGFVDSDKPVNLSAEQDTVSIYLSLDQSADHHCLMMALDADLIDQLKFLLEFGYDISYDRGRGGVGFRLGLLQSFSLQLGILWPGVKLDEDIDIPVLPHFSMFWRF